MVTLNTTTPNTGEDIMVIVNATDDTAVVSVEANDVALFSQGGNIWSGTITTIAGTHAVNVSATDAAGNIGWNNSTSYTATTQDTTPPSSITNPHSTSGTTHINWTWTNPLDSDFNHTEIYLNGIFQTNTSAEFFNATGLIPNTEYEISTRTVDDLGNINETWVNDTTMTHGTPPVSNASGPYTGIEGQAIIFNASASYDPDPGDSIASFEWDFNNDGSTDATGMEATWTWNDDHTGQVNLTVTDSHGENSTDTTSVTILNAPPEVEAGNNQTVNEGDTVSFIGDFTDPGIGDTHTIEWNFGDGTPGSTGTLEPTHVYADNGTYSVTLTVTDDDGASTSDTLNVTVENVAPIVDAGEEQTTNEGDIVSFAGSFTDPGTADTHLIEWDFGDGTTISPGTLTPTHTYADNGTYTVNLTVTDDDGASTSDTLIVTVNNVAPVLDECANQTVQWGDNMTLSRSFTDPGDDSWTAEIDWGDDSQEEGILSSKIITATHVYSIPGEYIYTLTVLDDDGGVGSGDMQITVTTRATELEYIGDLSAQYSDYINLKAQLNDPGNNNPLPDRSINFILGTQTATATTGPDGIATTSFKLDQPAGSYDIKAEFDGDDSYSPDNDTEAMQISRENAEITYTGDTILPTTAGSIDLRATLEEIDTEYGDLTEINVNFNIYKSSDLSYSNPVATIPSVASISVTSSGMGVGTATATIDNLPEDDYMIIARIVPNDYYLPISSNPTPMIVYEPTDQFTTGGGWIWDPTASHGNFGFNVKYHKKGKVKGNSIYVYRLDGLDYIVKSNAWIGLAISDNTSTFQGKAVLQIFDPVTGELQPESSGNFQFTVEATDNELNGNPDYYKITVLDKDGLEYHNATGSLEGGNIVIHDKKSK
jgi:PKD repeat protein